MNNSMWKIIVGVLILAFLILTNPGKEAQKDVLRHSASLAWCFSLLVIEFFVRMLETS